MGLDGYSRYKPKEFFTVFTAASHDETVGGGVESKSTGSSAIGAGVVGVSSGSCCNSFHVGRRVRTGRPVAEVAGTGDGGGDGWCSGEGGYASGMTTSKVGSGSERYINC